MRNWAKQMRQLGIALGFAAAILVSYELGASHSSRQTATGSRRVLYYVDPMHPAYKSDKPGIAPDCGMALKPVYADEVSAQASAGDEALPPEAVRIDAASQRLAGIRLATIKEEGTTRVIHAVGRVLAEDTRLYRVNSGVDGFVRETYGDAVGTFVAKDQKLATYYAPDFLAAASGFLAANERIPGSVTKEGIRSIQNYTDRLRNLGMTDLQIKHIAESKQLPESIDVLAPADGVILARNISSGQHFTHELEFYQIADLKKVWVVAELYQQDEPYLHPGAEAEIATRDEGQHFRGHITNSLFQSESSGGTVKVRLEVDNPRLVLRPDMVVDAGFSVRVPHAIVVPVDAVLDSGTQQRVYVEHGNGVFEPRAVETGWRTETSVQILKGVQPGERVVVGSTFLVDSESRLKSARQPALARTAASFRPEQPAMARP